MQQGHCWMSLCIQISQSYLTWIEALAWQWSNNNESRRYYIHLRLMVDAYELLLKSKTTTDSICFWTGCLFYITGVFERKHGAAITKYLQPHPGTNKLRQWLYYSLYNQNKTKPNATAHIYIYISWCIAHKWYMTKWVVALSLLTLTDWGRDKWSPFSRRHFETDFF